MRLRLICVLLVLCLLGLPGFSPAASAAGDIPGIADYWRLVSQTREQIVALQGRPDSEVQTALNALANQWENLRQVRLDDGSLVNLNNEVWVSQFRAAKPDLKRLGQEVDALLSTQPSHSIRLPGDARNSLDQVLARPEFQAQQQAPGWLQDLINRFMEWLTRLLGRSQGLSLTGNPFTEALGVAAAVLVGLALIYILRGLFSSMVRDASIEAEMTTSGLPLSAQSALDKAESLSTQGDYRSAVRYLYLSSLLILDERGLLFYDRTRTNRQYLRDLASRPQTSDLLRAVVDIFDRVWYGFQPIDADTYRRYAEQVDQLREQK